MLLVSPKYAHDDDDKRIQDLYRAVRAKHLPSFDLRLFAVIQT